MNVFKIALQGFNVSRSRPDQEAIDSLYASPKINTQANPPHAGIINLGWKSANLSYTGGTVKTLYSFKHGYNYIPTVFGTYFFTNTSITDHGIFPFQLGALSVIMLDADDLYVNLKYVSIDAGVTVINPFKMKIRYYVMAERGYE